MELDKQTLENIIDSSLLLHLKHPTDAILRDSLNSEQLMYREQFGVFYKPTVPVEVIDEEQYVTRGYN